MKTCPECAEEVRAEALKCRFCGYRFDLRRAGATRSRGLGGVLGMLRRPAGPQSPYDLLSAWAVDPAPGEIVREWLPARMTDAHGYLVLTDRRLLLFESTGRGHYELRHESPVDEISHITPAPGRGNGVMVRLPGCELRLRGMTREGVERACAQLTARGG